MDRTNGGRSERSKAPGADLLGLDVGSAGPGEVTQRLVEQLRDLVVSGRVVAGEQLPATRVLAEQLGVSRGVVTEAFGRLADEGLVEGRGRAGTVVLPGLAAPPAGRPAPSPPTVPGLRQPSSTEGFEHLRSLPAEVDLSPGVPDLDAFPAAAWLRAERAVLGRASRADLGYGDPQGHPLLREAVTRWVARTRGIVTGPDGVVVVAGVAQGLSLLANLLLRRGVDAVAVEDPGSLGARHQLQAWGLRTPPATVDGDGMRVESLRGTGAVVVMLTPAHQFPTGVVLAGQRRAEVLTWASEVDGLVVEDDYDAEHRYDRHPVAALAATVPDRVYYVSSVSKLLAPALRVGWVVPPAHLLEEVVALKRDTDLGNATLPQLVLAELMRSGALERHLRQVRRRHRRRRDALLSALEGRTRTPVEVLGAAAGLHLALVLPPDVDDGEVAAACLRRGVKVHPLSWHCQRPGPVGLIVGYAATPPDRLTRAAADVAAAVDEVASPSSRRPTPDAPSLGT